MFRKSLKNSVGGRLGPDDSSYVVPSLQKVLQNMSGDEAIRTSDKDEPIGPSHVVLYLRYYIAKEYPI